MANYDSNDDDHQNYETFESWMFDQREMRRNMGPTTNVDINVSHVYRSRKAIEEGNF
jgi:hypothetical protein